MSRKVKILYIIGTLDVGGSEGQLVRLVTGLDRQRFEPLVCCLSSAGPYQSVLDAAGIPVEVIGFRGLTIFRHPYRVALQLCRLIHFIRRVRPVLVHGFLFWAYILGTYAAKVASVPIVIASRRSLGTFKAGQAHYLLLERLTNAMTDLWVANSEAVRQDTVRQEGVDPARIRVIPNGVDPNRFAGSADRPTVRHRLGLPADGPLLLTVSNLIHYKGHGTLLEAVSLITRKHPTARFVLAGEGPMRAEIERRIATAGLADLVRVLGERIDIPDLLRAADLLVHPSDEEGFPNAILEAMAAGRPVVATRVGGTPELVVDGVTGTLVPPRSPAALAAAVSHLLADSQLADRMGAAGRERAVREFSLARMVERTEALYAEVLRSKLGLEYQPVCGWVSSRGDTQRSAPGSSRQIAQQDVEGGGWALDKKQGLREGPRE